MVAICVQYQHAVISEQPAPSSTMHQHVSYSNSPNTHQYLGLSERSCCFGVLLTVHLSILIAVINQLDAQNFCLNITQF